MATRMGAPGVRIELHDRSGYSLVENPNAVAGVVGFAPRGELNKIQRLTNTAQQDLYFGLGFNNSRYNQGMYAARAVINAGGFVEFVRPYGEEIDRTQDNKRDLKTDTYVVSYDRNAANNKENLTKTSIKVDYFASTRYKTDGAAKYGVSRKINNIAETIVNNSNTNFNVDASDEVFAVKENFISNGGSARGASDMVMFAIMNADPSSANRAYTSYELDENLLIDSNKANGELTVTTKGKVGFAVDDILFTPATTNVKILGKFRVTNIVDKAVTIVAEDEATKNAVALQRYRPEYLFYYDADNAVADGYDYLTVKTAVAGQGAKTFNSLNFTSDSLEQLKAIQSGSSIVLRDQDANEIYVRVATPTNQVLAETVEGKDDVSGTLVLPESAADAIWTGDSIMVEWGTVGDDGSFVPASETSSGTFTVTGCEAKGTFTITQDSKDTHDISEMWTWDGAFRVSTESSGWIDSVNTLTLTVTENSTVQSVVSALLACMQSESVGYGLTPIVADIATNDGNPVVTDKKKIKLLPGGALDFVAGDTIAITRASVYTEVSIGTEPSFNNDNILYLGRVKSSDAITDTIEVYDDIDTSKFENNSNLEFQVLNLTQTNKVAYAAVDTCKFVSEDVAADEVSKEYKVTKVSSGSDFALPVYTISAIECRSVNDLHAGDTVTCTYNNDTYEDLVVDDDFTFTIVPSGATKEGTRENHVDVEPDGIRADAITITLVNGVQPATTPVISSVHTVYTLKTAGSDAANPVYRLDGIAVEATCTDTDVAVGDTVKCYADGDVTKDPTYTAAVTERNGNTIKFLIVFDTPVTKEGSRSEGEDVEPTVIETLGTIKVHASAKDYTKDYADIYVIGNYSVMVPISVQDKTPVIGGDDDLFVGEGKPFKTLVASDTSGKKFIIERSERVLTDATIGATFVGLGLANIRYMDVNYTGTAIKVYDLTDEGEAIARLYMAVSYFYNGVLYEFDGTVVKYVYNDMQLFIGDTAENELEGSGVTFVLNDSGVMEMFREDNSYDLSTTVEGAIQLDGTYKAIPSSTTICSAFNPDDPAIINNAVWTYDPANNCSTSTISNAFNLFLDKDKADVTFFVAAGLGLNNFGLKGYETLNTQVMQAILSICELRKDCFALFDGVAESRINNVLKLDSPASRFGSTLGRWGAIYDARPIFYDSIVTKSNVEIAPSIPMASLITANRRASIFWHVPAGEDTGMIPGAWCRKLKYERKFNIPEDPDSDIAKLCDIHVNPFRSNKKGIYCYGDFTMQMEDTAFNAINVTMLVAGIHKMFYNYLDSRVFRLNTAPLRAQITGDLQAKLDQIISDNPAGLDLGSQVICDDTNNTPDVIEAHKLYVDLMLYPTTSTRYIYLRTNVLSKSTGNVISTDISTGVR